MKRILLFSVSTLLLFAGCAKQSGEFDAEEAQEEKFSLAVTAGIDGNDTRAVSDNDGHGKKVDHWVMEVRDVDGNVYTRDEKNGVAAGTRTQKFNVTLVKGNSYTFQFWADTKGAYVTDNLTAISTVDTVANKDTRDAFSANVSYNPSMGKTLSATLKRPFAQLNIQTTDLGELWETTKGATSRTEYDRFEPKDLKATLSIPTTFNVQTQTAGAAASVTLAAERVYTAYQNDSITLKTGNNFYNHVNPATFFMDYIFAGTEKALYNVVFSFTTNEESVNYDFASIPLQRNWRTNVRGSLMTDATQWTVTIDPEWSGEETVSK